MILTLLTNEQVSQLISWMLLEDIRLPVRDNSLLAHITANSVSMVAFVSLSPKSYGGEGGPDGSLLTQGVVTGEL